MLAEMMRTIEEMEQTMAVRIRALPDADNQA